MSSSENAVVEDFGQDKHRDSINQQARSGGWRLPIELWLTLAVLF